MAKMLHNPEYGSAWTAPHQTGLSHRTCRTARKKERQPVRTAALKTVISGKYFCPTFLLTTAGGHIIVGIISRRTVGYIVHRKAPYNVPSDTGVGGEDSLAILIRGNVIDGLI